jgi:hypothetical protein
MRKAMAEMSDRTFDTFWSAFTTIRTIDGLEASEVAMTSATQPNGSLNVSKLKRSADSAAMRFAMARSLATAPVIRSAP